MGWFGVGFRLAVFVAFIAALAMLPAFHEHRQQLTAMLSMCPLHWFRGADVSQSGTPASESSSIIRSGDDRLFTVDELQQFDGTEGSRGLCVAVLGSVYDVSSGSQHYGPDGGYSFFAGKDASRAFVTGDFTEAGLVDDVSGLTSAQWLDLLHWFRFYEKSYRYAGKLIGRFYDDGGVATEALVAVQNAIENALIDKRREDDQQKIFPPCNSQWTQASGLTVWCSDKSGGISRSWDGVPRKFFDASTQQTSCVCVRTTGAPSDASLPDSGIGDLGHPSLRQYDNCPPESNVCAVV